MWVVLDWYIGAMKWLLNSKLGLCSIEGLLITCVLVDEVCDGFHGYKGLSGVHVYVAH